MTKKFWICGYHTVLAAIQNKNRIIHRVAILEKFINDSQIHFKKNIEKIKFFEKLFGKQFAHQGIAAEIEELQLPKFETEVNNNNFNKIIILDGITDPRNIGSIFRSALAFNFKHILINEKEINPTSFEMYKASSGSIENLKIFKVSNIKNGINILKKNNFWVYGLDSKANKEMKELKLPEKIAYVFGSEGFGIKTIIKKYCDDFIKIKIHHIESLNVSNAVSALLALHNYHQD